MSNTNPYAPPGWNTESLETGDAIEKLDRITARRNVRSCLLILLVPGLYNHIWYLRVLAVPQDLADLIRVLDTIGLAVLAIAIWLLGLVALELITRILFRLFSRCSILNDWHRALYATLGSAPRFAIAGAALWIGWIVAFYELGMDFYTVSVPVGIIAHLLAAGLYLPLFASWLRLERACQ